MKKFMKIIAIMCVATLVFTALAGCGGDEDTTSDTAADSSYSTDTTDDTETMDTSASDTEEDTSDSTYSTDSTDSSTEDSSSTY